MSHLANYELAVVTYFEGDLTTFHPLADRALGMNPRNTATCGLLAVLISFSGDWERGYELVRRCMTINPNHAAWLHFVPFNYHFEKGNYLEALASIKRANMPEFPWTSFSIAIVSAELGLWAEAAEAVRILRERFPWMLLPKGAKGYVRPWIQNPEVLARRNASLRKAIAGPPADAAREA